MVIIEVFTLEEWDKEQQEEKERLEKEEGYKNRTYLPEDEEFVNEINQIFRENPKFDRDSAKIGEEVKKRKATWKVSVKRIKGFMREE